MKTKLILVSVLISAGLVTGAFAAQGGGKGNANRGGGSGSSQSGANCDQAGTGQCTPQRDGSGKAKSPGKGAKDGSGKKSNCPAAPAS
jgi:hypothetical protein